MSIDKTSNKQFKNYHEFDIGLISFSLSFRIIGQYYSIQAYLKT